MESTILTSAEREAIERGLSGGSKIASSVFVDMKTRVVVEVSLPGGIPEDSVRAISDAVTAAVTAVSSAVSTALAGG